MAERRIVNVADIAMREIGDGKGFAARFGQAGSVIGSTGIGCSLVVVPPGKSAFPFHRHHISHELFVVLAGEGVTRLDEKTLSIRAGDIVAAPAGKEAHQIVNTGQGELRYLAISTEGCADIIDYPDSGKIAVGAAATTGPDAVPSIDLFGRVTPAAYYDGETFTGADPCTGTIQEGES